jgi:hypothetical protein
MSLDECIKETEDGEQTAIVHLVHLSTGRKVDLFGMCHVGNSKYYQRIMNKLKEEDIVLYEGGAKIVPYLSGYASSETNKNYMIIIDLKKRMIAEKPKKKKDWEELAEELRKRTKVISQTEGINYYHLPDNWKNVDISSKELRKKLDLDIIKHLENYEIAGLFSFLPNWLGGRKIREFGLKQFDYVKKKEVFEKINREREEKIYEIIDDLESKSEIKRIGVMYGADHIPLIQERLFSKGYVLDVNSPIEWMNAILSVIGAFKEFNHKNSNN